MEGQQNVLFKDFKMLNLEEGEISAGNEVANLNVNHDSDNAQQRKGNRKKKRAGKKNRRRSRSCSSINDISRFVPDVCRRLKERKSYLIWAAVACLGASALSDLVNEVGAIQACGGQKTVDGNRFRSGGGILWNILKRREPEAFKEIMRRGKEFEKQFRPQNVQKDLVKNDDVPSLRKITSMMKDLSTDTAPDVQNHIGESTSNCEEKECKLKYIHSRLRAPVSYDDSVEDESEAEEVV